MKHCLYKLATVIVISAATSCSNPSNPTDAKSVFAPFPNTTISYYEVAGTDFESIRAQMNLKGPKDPVDGKQVDALSTWNIDWHWPPDAQGRCDLSRLTTNFRAMILLPRLTKTESVKQEVLDAWNDYLSHLMQHEANHVRYAYDHVGNLENDIKASTCDFANATGYAALDRIKKFDKDYDLKTGHGKTEDVHFP